MTHAYSRALLCDRTREWSTLRLDAELSEFEHALMSAHLDRCGSCRRFAADVRAIADALRAAPAEQPAEPIASPTRRRVATRPAQVAAAAAVFLVAAGIGAVFGSLPAGSVERATRAAPMLGANPDAQLRALRVDALKPERPLQRGKLVSASGTSI
jgi:predicted anti-sigma-YlaC factor YlaD